MSAAIFFTGILLFAYEHAILGMPCFTHIPTELHMGCWTMPPVDSNHQSVVQALQKIEAFVANVKECDRLICDFVSSLMSQILTPLQMARCLVAAYPYWPDTLAISTYIAAAAGQHFSLKVDLILPHQGCVL